MNEQNDVTWCVFRHECMENERGHKTLVFFFQKAISFAMMLYPCAGLRGEERILFLKLFLIILATSISPFLLKLKMKIHRVLSFFISPRSPFRTLLYCILGLNGKISFETLIFFNIIFYFFYFIFLFFL